MPVLSKKQSPSKKASSNSGANSGANSNTKARGASSKTANAAAPKSSRRAARSNVSDEVRDCWRSARAAGGQECLAKGDGCEILRECGTFGVGSELWPIDRFIDGDELNALIAKFGKPNWNQGKRCITDQLKQHYTKYHDECNQKFGYVPRRSSRTAPAAPSQSRRASKTEPSRAPTRTRRASQQQAQV